MHKTIAAFYFQHKNTPLSKTRYQITSLKADLTYFKHTDKTYKNMLTYTFSEKRKTIA